MAKKPVNFRVSNEDFVLLDELVERITSVHSTDFSKTSVLIMAIRRLAAEYFTNEEIEKIHQNSRE